MLKNKYTYLNNASFTAKSYSKCLHKFETEIDSNFICILDILTKTSINKYATSYNNTKHSDSNEQFHPD